MKNTKKNALKALVMLALFCPAVFADGEMGGGGLSASAETSRTGKTVIILGTEDDGEMGGGGRPAESSYVGSLLTSIFDYFDRIM